MSNFKTDETIKVKEREIENVEKYKYLDQIQLKDCTKEEVLRRIKSGRSCFGRQ